LAAQIDTSDSLLAVLPRGNESSWFFAELAIALDKASKSEQFRIIPVVAHAGSKVPFVLRDRLGLDLTEGNYEASIDQLAAVLMSDATEPTSTNALAARAAATDARRAYLYLLKAQHELEKAQSRKVLALGVASSLSASVVTAVPFIYLKGLTETHLWSLLVGFVILATGVFVGRLSRDWPGSRSKREGSEVGER
jgi:hypothetical protein